MDEVKEPAKTGRPTDYTKELVDEICSRLAMGESMRTVCKDDKMPALTTVFRWLREKPEFKSQYDLAKRESADAMSEEILDIADNGVNDWMETHYGKDGDEVGWRLNGEALGRSRLRVDTRKWYMSKIMPKKYGDKVDVTTNGKDLPTPILGIVPNAIPSDNSDTESDGDEVPHQGDSGGDIGIENGVDRPLLDSLGAVGQEPNAN
jgi:hypothetical protein